MSDRIQNVGKPVDQHVPEPAKAPSQNEDGKEGEGELTEADLERRTKQEVTEAVVSAEATKPGSAPGAFTSQVKEWAASRIRWDTHLLRTLQSRAGEGEDRRKGSTYKRRMLGDPPQIRRRLSSDKVGTVAIAVDTSASVNDDMLKQFFGELHYIFEDVTPEEVYVFWVDADIQHVDHLVEDDVEDGVMTLHERRKSVPGRRGTRFNPPFDYLRARSIVPDQFVYLTDGYSDFLFSPPEYPTLWVITGAVTAPEKFGDTVRLRV